LLSASVIRLMQQGFPFFSRKDWIYSNVWLSTCAAVLPSVTGPQVLV